MPEEKRLEARPLPYDVNVVVAGQPDRAFRSLRVAFSLVVVDEHETLSGIGPGPTEKAETSDGKFNPVQRVASAGTEFAYVQMNVKADCVSHILEKLGIANLGRAFAPDENHLPLRNDGTTTFHPMRGTPP